MAEEVNNAANPEEEELLEEDTLGARFMDWVRNELVWYAGSFTFHLLLLSTLLLFAGSVETMDEDARRFDEVKAEKPDSDEPTKFEKFDIGEADDQPPPELDVDPTLEKPGHEAVTEDYIDDNPVYQPRGGGTPTGSKEVGVGGGAGVLAFGAGPKVAGAAGIGVGVGTGTNWGSGGSGTGFGGRGSGHRKAMAAVAGGTKRTERAVTAALIWLAKHQMHDGSWSLDYTPRCVDKTCTGPGNVKADTGATAMGVLPFLAAGQTHRTKGPYRQTVDYAIRWLISHQKPDGDLASGHGQKMYSHGLATIALCEAYGLSGDHQVGMAAQGAVNFIVKAQNANDGGWRYNPGDPGDTSVVGWQLMALKSAKMAGLSSSGGSDPFAGTSKWLDSVSHNNGATYSYQPGGGPSDTMTSVGLLCRQYLGAKRDNPMLIGGMKYLQDHPPVAGDPHVYYWYYATQVMHNMSGYEWDDWNRKMRKVLVDTQTKDTDSCANGSWNPAKDRWGSRGGRLMETALSALTLEIYYRYLPLFKAEAGAGEGGAPAAAPKADKKADAADAGDDAPAKAPAKAKAKAVKAKK